MHYECHGPLVYGIVASAAISLMAEAVAVQSYGAACKLQLEVLGDFTVHCQHESNVQPLQELAQQLQTLSQMFVHNALLD